MADNNYNYLYSQGMLNYKPTDQQNQAWSNWSIENRQFQENYARTATAAYTGAAPMHYVPPPSTSSPAPQNLIQRPGSTLSPNTIQARPYYGLGKNSRSPQPPPQYQHQSRRFNNDNQVVFKQDIQYPYRPDSQNSYRSENQIAFRTADSPSSFRNEAQNSFKTEGTYRSDNPYNNQAQQQSPNWQRNKYKRSRNDSHTSANNYEQKPRTNKKKKKPLSQNVPSKKAWLEEEAVMAINLEKEYNKRFKNHSLIIKFPDLELNREIVSKLHSAIESVHFQQPSTPRFCFVTLQEGTDADTVIESLNKTKFGDGYLTTEYKRDREEDQAVGPDDIDPLTLYIGNLAQEITKKDMVNMYPNNKRIDIGFAKKMKYTRYAFVSFKNVIDAIEAFRKTHSKQMYSKSLIVRFRRLHGTVGMPGEPKTPNQPKTPTEECDNLNGNANSENTSQASDIGNDSLITNRLEESFEEQPLSPSLMSDSYSLDDNESGDELKENKSDLMTLNDIDLSLVKDEPEEEEFDTKSDLVKQEFITPFLPESADVYCKKLTPIALKSEIKEETLPPDAEYEGEILKENGIPEVKTEPLQNDEDALDDDSDGLEDMMQGGSMQSMLDEIRNNRRKTDTTRKFP